MHCKFFVFLLIVFLFFSFFSSACEFCLIERIGAHCKQNPDFIIIIIIIILGSRQVIVRLPPLLLAQGFLLFLLVWVWVGGGRGGFLASLTPTGGKCTWAALGFLALMWRRGVDCGSPLAGVP